MIIENARKWTESDELVEELTAHTPRAYVGYITVFCPSNDTASVVIVVYGSVF